MSRNRKDINRNNRTSQRRILLMILIGLLLAGILGWWEVYRSYHQLVVRSEIYQTDKVDHEVRIALISDLHDRMLGVNNSDLIQEIEELSPDLIFMDGDMVNEDTADFTSLTDLAGHLTQIADVYFSLGNKEVDHPDLAELESLLENEGVTVLDKDYRDVSINGNRIRIGGLYDYSFALNAENTVDLSAMNPETVEFLQKFQNTNDLKIMLTHRPDTFLFNRSVDYWKVDLALAGHYHGGQVILPVLGGLWAPDRGWFPDYTDGMKQLGSLTLITTKGLGSGNEKLPRFNNPPELLEICIVPENQQS